MKKKLTTGDTYLRDFRKALLLMKLSFLLILAGSLQVSANVNGQTSISLKVNKVEISKVLKTIERQGTYRFLYNSRLNDMRNVINLDVSNASIGETLKKAFTGTDLTFKILDNNLVVVLSSTLAVQDITVTGKVTGDNGEALSNVSVTVKGTSRGATSDNNGTFTITTPEDATLVFS